MTDQLDLLDYVAPEPAFTRPSNISVANYLAWWLADDAIQRGELDPEMQPLHKADAAAHEVCRSARYLVFETRGTCSRWWLTDEGRLFALEHAGRAPASDHYLEADEATVGFFGDVVQRREAFDPNAPPPCGRPLLLVIDATNLGHRLWHAPSDLPVSERFGFALTRWRKTIEPDFAVAIFDGPGDGWREAIYPAYKGTRIHDPSKRPSATDWRDIQAACRGARLRVVQVDGVEADDLIGSYTVAAVAAGYDVAILSGDKDMNQLVADAPTRVRQHDPGGRDVWGPAEVQAKYGVEPGQLADYLAIVGDKSDNYPGIVGVGKTRAAGLLAKFGTLEAVLANANLIPGNRARIVREGAAQARLCRRLSGLVTDLPLPIAIRDCTWSGVRERVGRW
jgi:5'-3' exonuclease